MAKRDEIARQGLIILDAKGVADARGTAGRLEDAGWPRPPPLRVAGRHRRDPAQGGRRGVAARRGVRSFHAGAVRDTPRGLSEAEAARACGVEPARLAAIRDRQGEAAARRRAMGYRGRHPARPARRPAMTHVGDERPARASARWATRPAPI